jgi:adenylylsulfate kinase-like enzyme
MVIWITGRPGAGKTTIANLLLKQLRDQSQQCLLLDGDALRNALQINTYDIKSRKALALTYARLAKMFSEQGSIAICATVSMFDSVRQWNADNIKDYFEVYVNVSEEVLQQRDQKNLYSEGAKGTQINVVGFDIAIEEPKNPDLVLCNDGHVTAESLVNQILEKITL